MMSKVVIIVIFLAVAVSATAVASATAGDCAGDCAATWDPESRILHIPSLIVGEGCFLGRSAAR